MRDVSLHVNDDDTAPNGPAPGTPNIDLSKHGRGLQLYVVICKESESKQIMTTVTSIMTVSIIVWYMITICDYYSVARAMYRAREHVSKTHELGDDVSWRITTIGGRQIILQHANGEHSEQIVR